MLTLVPLDITFWWYNWDNINELLYDKSQQFNCLDTKYYLETEF